MPYNSGSTNDVNEYDGRNYNQWISEEAERQAAAQAAAAEAEAARKASAENEARTSTPNDPYAAGQGASSAVRGWFGSGKSRRSRRSKRSKRTKRTRRTRRR